MAALAAVLVCGGVVVLYAVTAPGYGAIGQGIGQGIATGAGNAGSVLGDLGKGLDRLGQAGTESGWAAEPSTPEARLRRTTLVPNPDGTIRACADVNLIAGRTLTPAEWTAGSLPKDGPVDTSVPTMQPVAVVEPAGAAIGRVCIDVRPGIAFIQWIPEPGKTRTWAIATAAPTTR
jgi:hypothetical protein